MLQPLLDWLKQHEWLVLALGVFSAVTFVLGLILVPYVVVRLPADYFCEGRRRETELGHRHPVLRWTWHIGKNALGLVLALAGVIMLVTPGPGIPAILAGLMLLDFPGKYALERWIVSRGPVLHALNVMRKKAGREPLVLHPPA